ncbi:hypothetical protein [Demequina sp. SO4-18]|uniref:hypothetical protein n=1 Tax=Demequina sp. SO4-18 TaxID=3401026 RepID=UPI003B58E696
MSTRHTSPRRMNAGTTLSVTTDLRDMIDIAVSQERARISLAFEAALDANPVPTSETYVDVAVARRAIDRVANAVRDSIRDGA